MKPQTLKGLEARLMHFLENLLEPMGRSERQHWAQVYVQGLLLDGERESIEPMAQRIVGADVQALRQFVGQSPWAVEEVQRRLAHKVVDLLSDAAVWIIDETSFPKAGQHSVGVARQYCGTLGKIANCQVAVSLHWSSTDASCPLVWRLYLPRAWLEDPARAQEVKLPPGMVYRSKTELALEAVDQALAWELPPLAVLADSAYGNDFSFRQALRERQLQYRVTWRQGSRGAQRSRFVMLAVWAAHGWQQQAHLERVREWLLVEWPAGEKEPTKYWLAQLGAQPLGLRRFVRTAKARGRIEQDYRELKEALGLDHYEGRQWLGWQHHLCLVTIAYAFLRAEQARLKKNCWCELEPAPGPQAPAGPAYPA